MQFSTMPRRRVYLMRHGEVSYFAGGAPSLRAREAELNEAGRAQAAAAGAVLADVPIDRVVTSGLPRSVETARLAMGERNLPIERHEALVEIAPGRLTDIRVENLVDTVTKAFSAGISAEARFLAGETFGSLVERVLGCWQALVGDPSWRKLLVVAHGGVNRVLLTHAFGSGLAGFGSLEQDPGCINIVDVEPDGRLLVRLVNFTPDNALKNGLELTTMERLFVEYLESHKPASQG
ncbi:MAG: histidine phosphatase family protein [Pirellulales bacterium]|nr:histidine phosphatase family protein [Pirellulales bacterium]